MLIEELRLFPRVRYNKVVERLNRYEELLIGCLRLFKLEGLRIVDSKPIETKKLSRLGRHRKKGELILDQRGRGCGLQPVKRGFYVGYKMTCYTDGRYLNLLYIDPANKHDITIIKEHEEDFSERFSGCTVLLDKGYIDEKFSEAMRAKGVEYIAIKRDNMVKSEHERHHYQLISRVRRIIETRFAQLEEFGARIIRAVSRKGLAVKITLSILSFNIHQMMKGA